MPSISPLIGKKSNFTNVTNCLFGRKLITIQELNGITSQQNLTDDERGSRVAFILYEKIEESAKNDPREGPVRCLMAICDVFEDQIINDASLKTHAASMRSKIALSNNYLIKGIVIRLGRARGVFQQLCHFF